MRSLMRVMLVSLTLLVPVAFAQTSSPRVVLKGYDPVAYFTDSRPVQGSSKHAFDWDGERYHFSSAENRSRFAADPERYAPQFGGYCTGSMSRKVKNEADPKAWIISGGKLYVFGQPKFMDMARKDPQWLATRIPLASTNWREARK